MFRQIGSPGDQMSLEEFSNVSTRFELVAYSRTLKPSKCFKADVEILDEATEDWLICMTLIKQAAVAEVFATPKK